MGLTEYALLIVVVLGMPLAIAGAVTLWSLKQVRYRPKQRGPRPAAGDAPTPEDAGKTSDAPLG